MGNWLYLIVEEKEILSWKYYIPHNDISVLSFIFRPSDKQIVKGEGRWNSLIYKTTVGEVKKRLKEISLDKANIEKTLTTMLKIPIKKLKMALMDEETFGDEYGYDDKVWDEKDNYDEIIESTDIGEYPLLYHIATEIDTYPDDAGLKLDLSQLYLNKKELEKLTLIPEDFYSDVKLERLYSHIAKVSFTKGDFDLVYISLIIAFESSINSYIKKKYLKIQKSRKGIFNLEKMFKGLSLVNLFRFSVAFLGNKKIDESLLNAVEKVYNKRNNIIHNNARRFNRMDVVEAIKIIERAINLLENLK